jgi:serine/threonine protein phosphatase PrpC
VAALLFGSSAYIINVGDSRGYLFSDGELRQITTDHSFIEQLIVSGFVAPQDRYTHPQRNQILRSLGDDVDIDIDFFEQKLKPGMRLLLCCDGLWEMVRDDEIGSILRESAGPQEACDRLIESANEHGGEDNISVVVIEVYD